MEIDEFFPLSLCQRGNINAFCVSPDIFLNCQQLLKSILHLRQKQSLKLLAVFRYAYHIYVSGYILLLSLFFKVLACDPRLLFTHNPATVGCLVSYNTMVQQ